jgi:predicted nucleic acid-binding protein
VSCIVVGNTGPLLHLNEANAIHLLEPAGQILIPPVVSQELASRIDLPSWVNIEELNRSAQAKANDAHELLYNLVNSSLWISKRVVNEASRAIDELFSE